MPAPRKTHTKYVEELFEREINFDPLEEYKGALVPIKHLCMEGHIVDKAPSYILRGDGCSVCR